VALIICGLFRSAISRICNWNYGFLEERILQFTIIITIIIYKNILGTYLSHIMRVKCTSLSRVHLGASLVPEFLSHTTIFR